MLSVEARVQEIRQLLLSLNSSYHVQVMLKTTLKHPETLKIIADQIEKLEAKTLAPLPGRSINMVCLAKLNKVNKPLICSDIEQLCCSNIPCLSGQDTDSAAYWCF